MTTVSAPPDTLLRLTFVRRYDDQLNFAELQRYFWGVRSVMTVGYRVAVELEEDDADVASNFDASELRVRRVSYASPMEVVFDIAPWGAAFAASRGVIWLWERVNRARIGHAKTRVELARLRNELTTVKQNPATVSDWEALERFVDDTERIALTEPGEQPEGS
ncbi:hypothetical protein [Blastococcus colisei]|uniref:hypothetical protein n=1 Tax=Blastococcus colisei TaxID=1564162 RepID=UPI00114E0867|nr:hypothetical protein [Blastococcus colisei]